MNTAITLYYKSGSSDKIYQVQVVPDGEAFRVNFQYGRRGSTLATGTKTQSPVSAEQAEKIFEKLVAEKTAKGYTPGEDGTPYQFTDKEERQTGIIPQLLNPIDETELEALLEDDAWCLQEKFDGKRLQIRKTDDIIEGINRLGLTVGLPQPIQDEIACMESTFVLDGEAIGDVFHAFDLRSLGGLSMRYLPYSERYRQLVYLLGNNPKSSVQVVMSIKGKKAKNTWMELLRADNVEGVVFKRLDSPYVPGRPASGGDQLKFKFYATATCVVTKINNKRSVSLGLFDDQNQKVAVGNVTIPANQAIPAVGDLVEVRYLYAFPGGSLFQPTFLGVRDDALPIDCTVSQLKFKADEQKES